MFLYLSIYLSSQRETLSVLEREREREREDTESTELGDCQFHPITLYGGACGVIVIVAGNGHGHTSSNPGQG